MAGRGFVASAISVLRSAGGPLLWGLAGTAALLSLYYVILAWTTKDLRHPFDQFLLYKYWMIPLLLGFGIQMGLFGYVRRLMRRRKLAGAAAGTGAGTSGLAMVACCAHHLADVLPALGISAAATFLTKYQTHFLGLGVGMNALGVITMLLVATGRRPRLPLGLFFKGRVRTRELCHEEKP